MQVLKVKIPRRAANIWALILTVAITGCGGGGSDEPDTSPVVTITATALPLVLESPADRGHVPLPIETPTQIKTSRPSPTSQVSTSATLIQPQSTDLPVSVVTPSGASSEPARAQTVANASPTTGTTATSDIAPWLDLAVLPIGSLPTTLDASVQRADIISFISPEYLYPRRNIGLQCQGANATLVDIPTLAHQVEKTTGQIVQRFGAAGTVLSPVFRLELGALDLLPAGTSPRCELLPYPMPGSALPVGEVFWLSFSAWVDDWGGSTDEQSIAQMHIQDPRNIVLNPFVGLVVRGKELRVELRHNPQETPSQTTTTMVSTTRVALPTRRWFTTIIHGRISQDPMQQPFFRMWLDDVEVVHYQGPWGYTVRPDAAAYAKVGLYHWLNGNPWDTAVPTRSMMLGSLLLASDTAQRYSRRNLSTAVARPAQ